MGRPISLLDPAPLPLREGDYFEVIRPEAGEYDNYRVRAEAGSVVPATTVVKGVARYANNAESAEGEDRTLLISPARLDIAIRDMLENRFIQGDNTVLTYNPSGGTLTIEITGGAPPAPDIVINTAFTNSFTGPPTTSGGSGQGANSPGFSHPSFYGTASPTSIMGLDNYAMGWVIDSGDGSVYFLFYPGPFTALNFVITGPALESLPNGEANTADATIVATSYGDAYVWTSSIVGSIPWSGETEYEYSLEVL